MGRVDARDRLQEVLPLQRVELGRAANVSVVVAKDPLTGPGV
jgi:hypothetical protein